MAGPIETREREVVGAMADTLVARTNVLPTAHLTAPTTVDDAENPVLNVDTIDGFSLGGHVHWFDDTGERMAVISAINATGPTITLQYRGYDNHGFPVGLRYVHDAGALITTNLFMHRPMKIAPELHSDLPVITMFARRKTNREFTFGSTLAPMVVRVQVHLSLMQFDEAPIDPEAYNEMRQDLSKDYMQTVENAFNQNRHLMAMYNQPGNHAMGLGDGQSKEWAQSLWDVVAEEVEVPQAVGAMDVIVRPKKYVRQEPS